MLLVLVLFGGLQHAQAGDFPKDTNYVTKQNVSCPATGFFFQREIGSNSLGASLCYLCFCQNNGTATCWRRENRRCDLKHYRDFTRRIPRTRRSPLSLGEIFIRDAARDFFNKQSPEQCKPFESSFSDGCPPADWCIGCTVCDCDANGRWDCHILSFCNDKNGKREMKKRRGHSRNNIAKRQSKIISTKLSRRTITTRKPPKKPTRKRFVKSNVKGSQVKQSSAVKQHKINKVKASKVNKFTSIKKPLPKVQAKKAIPSSSKVTSRPLYIKKNVSTSKPLNIKSDSSTKNNTSQVAQKVVEQFMMTMQKVLKNIDRKTNSTSKQVNKIVQKRSMPKKDNKKNTKKGEQEPKFVKKPVSKIHKKSSAKKNTPKHDSSSTSKYGRLKREVINVKNVTPNSSKYIRVYAWNVVNNTNENVTTERTHDIIADNFVTSVLNISQNFHNRTVNVTQLKNSMDQILSVADNHTYKDNLNNVDKNGTFYNDVNKTESTIHWTLNNYGYQQSVSSNKVDEVLYLTTNRPYGRTDLMEYNNNLTDLTQNLLEKYKDRENQIYKKFSDVSTQTMHGEDHSCKYRTFLLKLIGSDRDQYVNRTQSFQTLKKPKKYTILNKIKRLFKKIFNKKAAHKFYYKADIHNGIHNYENCKINPKEKVMILRQRIHELKNESEGILRTIGIIKGLLHIVEINTNATQYRALSKSYDSNENVNKLNIIVNTDYKEKNSKKLTEDQRTQINYIKDNVQVFIKSIGKFARILDDVIQIAICHNKFNNPKVNKTNTANNYVVQYYSNKTQYKLEKLKKLFLNYNILQNNFIHQVYYILNNLEASMTEKYNLKTLKPNEYFEQMNKTDAIETNSANIIVNIRKLKQLAEKIQSQKRRKRSIIDDDDALEYLLILMEYLLKRHAPAYSSVNDGLDLLIEAIKSAPDIKNIRNKVLYNMTEKTLVTISTTPIHSLNKYTNNSTSNNEREQKNISVKVYNNKNKILDQPEDGDDDNDDDDKIKEIYRGFKFNNQLRSEQKLDDILSVPSSVSVTSASYYNVREATTHKSRNKNEGVELYKVIDDSFEEKVSTTSTAMVEDWETTPKSLFTSYGKAMNKHFKTHLKSNSNIDNLLVDSKANTDWIEENFKEIKQVQEAETTSTPKSVVATRTHKYKENMSDVTNEIELHNDEKVFNTSAEEIMSKKQLELLNSLDYVEDEMDSKDDKFSNDAYI